MTDLFNEGRPELAEDARFILQEIERESPGASAPTPNCRPPVDILENADSFEVVIDLPAVPAESLRVVIRRNTLVVVGSKPIGPLETRAKFHLAERNYGRFARAVRLAGAFDAANARAVVRNGQLSIRLPLMTDQRGRLFSIPVQEA